MLSAFLSTLFPSRCAGCHSLCDSDRTFCFLCDATVNPAANACRRCGQPANHPGGSIEEKECTRCILNPPPLFRSSWAWEFGGAVQQAIRQFKYAHRTDLARPLTQAYARSTSVHYDCVIPVPLHPRRRRERRYNQAALLAGEISKRTGIPATYTVLQRTRNTPSQTSLTAKMRQTNIKGAFAANLRIDLRGRTVLIVDDVATTGATLSECARVLRGAGAQRVDGWTIARGL